MIHQIASELQATAATHRMVAMKQVIVVNQTLKLPVGKLDARIAHAALEAFLAASHEAQIAWLQAGMPRIVVYSAHDAALLDLEATACQRQIPSCIIRDAWRTVVRAGTRSAK